MTRSDMKISSLRNDVFLKIIKSFENVSTDNDRLKMISEKIESTRGKKKLFEIIF